MIKICGHKPPDTDSVCAPISYAWYLSNIKTIKSEAIIQSEVNRETDFVLKYFNLEKPKLVEKFREGDNIILLDTTNPEEIDESYNQANIIEIIDHHKLSGITTSEPIPVTIRPIACTCTIIFEMMKDNNVKIPMNIAGAMISAILSDTLKFTSPTTTDNDKTAVKILASIAKIDIDKYCEEMFDAKSDLSGMSPKDILNSDSKIFDMNGKKIRISVLETTKTKNALSLKDELLQEMEKAKREEKLNAIFFFIVDILKISSDVLVLGKDEELIIEKAFNVKVFENKAHLKGIVSRKKQIVPKIENVV